MKISNNTPIVSNTSFKGSAKLFKEALKQDSQNFFRLTPKGTMQRALFIANAFVFLLGTRLITSRDKDEKREIFIRDVPSIYTAVLGVPIISKFFTNILQEKSGFGLMKTNPAPEKCELRKWFENKFNIKNNAKTLKTQDEVLSYAKLKLLYTYDPDLDVSGAGLDGFSKRLMNLNDKVNLKKIYSNLSKEIKEGIAGFENDNVKFLQDLAKKPEISGKIKEALSNSSNKALDKASSLKTIPAALGFGVTLTLLGLIIPKLNILITEKISKNREAKKNTQAKIA